MRQTYSNINEAGTWLPSYKAALSHFFARNKKKKCTMVKHYTFRETSLVHWNTYKLCYLTLRLLMPCIYMEHLFLMFLDHTQRRTTVGRTPLDEWSARRRDFYLTTHDTHNRQMSMPPVGFEPKISAGERQGRLPAEILGSNPTGGMDICLLWVSCVVR